MTVIIEMLLFNFIAPKKQHLSKSSLLFHCFWFYQVFICFHCMVLLSDVGTSRVFALSNKRQKGVLSVNRLPAVVMDDDEDYCINHQCSEFEGIIKLNRHRRDSKCYHRAQDKDSAPTLCSVRDTCGLWIRTHSVNAYIRSVSCHPFFLFIIVAIGQAHNICPNQVRLQGCS